MLVWTSFDRQMMVWPWDLTLWMFLWKLEHVSLDDMTSLVSGMAMSSGYDSVNTLLISNFIRQRRGVLHDMDTRRAAIFSESDGKFFVNFLFLPKCIGVRTERDQPHYLQIPPLKFWISKNIFLFLKENKGKLIRYRYPPLKNPEKTFQGGYL